MSDAKDFFSLIDWLAVHSVLAVLILSGALKVIVPEMRSLIRLLSRRRSPARRPNHGKSR
jgi:uncharacterized membrane protein YcjF (UPF0283 family)